MEDKDKDKKPKVKYNPLLVSIPPVIGFFMIIASILPGINWLFYAGFAVALGFPFGYALVKNIHVDNKYRKEQAKKGKPVKPRMEIIKETIAKKVSDYFSIKEQPTPEPKSKSDEKDKPDN